MVNDFQWLWRGLPKIYTQTLVYLFIVNHKFVLIIWWISTADTIWEESCVGAKIIFMLVFFVVVSSHFSFSVAEITPFTEQLLTNLFSALAIPGSSENEYIMKGASIPQDNVCCAKRFMYVVLVCFYVKLLKFSFDGFYSHHEKFLTSPGSHRAVHPYTDWPAHSEAPSGQQGEKIT